MLGTGKGGMRKGITFSIPSHRRKTCPATAPRPVRGGAGAVLPSSDEGARKAMHYTI